MDLHDTKGTFDFCGGMMFQLVLSEKLRSRFKVLSFSLLFRLTFSVLFRTHFGTHLRSFRAHFRWEMRTNQAVAGAPGSEQQPVVFDSSW